MQSNVILVIPQNKGNKKESLNALVSDLRSITLQEMGFSF